MKRLVILSILTATLFSLLGLTATLTRASATITELGCAESTKRWTRITLAVAPATTDVIIVHAAGISNGVVTTIKDTATNAYTQYASTTDGNYTSSIYVATNTNGLIVGDMITIGHADRDTETYACAIAVSGLDITPDDTAIVAPTTNGSSYTTGNLTAGSNGSLLIGGFFAVDSVTPTPDSPFLLSGQSSQTFMQYGSVGAGQADAVSGAFDLTTDYFGSAIALPLLTPAQVSLSGSPTLAEGTGADSSFDFTLTADSAVVGDQTIEYAVTASGANPADASDFVGGVLPSGTVTMLNGAISATISIPVVGDNIDEPDETFTVTINAVSGGIINGATITDTGIITNDDNSTLSISDATVSESDASASFTVSLSNPSTSVVTVDYATVDDSAVAGTDYVANSGTVTFNAGETSATITVSISDDNVVEGAESFTVDLSNASGATISDAQAIGTINDDDSTALSISDATVSESDASASFTVTLSNPSAFVVTVDYATTDDSAVAGSDYVANSGTVTFNAGETSATITIGISDDNVVEGAESFTVDLSNASGATINDAQAIGTINDDDSTALSISDATVSETDTNASFTVSLSNPSASAVTVDYTTVDDSAVAGSDYVAKSGTVTFNAGETSATITVGISDDNVVEGAESFTVDLSNASGATINDAQAIATINDDDNATISISDATVSETDASASFTVSLSNPSASVVTVDYMTTDDSAVAGSDYVANSGTVTFNAGETSATITVSISDDNVVEGAESFTVDLSNAVGATISDAQAVATINDDDSTALSISDVTVSESDASASFTVTLSNPSAFVVTVDYTTVDDSAVAGSDYVANSGTVTFNAGETSATITVGISDDNVVEGVESFTVDLSNASGATINDAQAVGTINDDDSATISISDATVSESDVSASFPVTLSNPSASVVTVDYATVDDSAVAGSDYVANSGTVTFNAGETSATITVGISDDNVVEGVESFTVDLSNASGATISDAQAIGTINDDDSATISISDATVSESDVSASFTVSLSNPSASVVTVDYATVDDSAEAGSDYTADSGTLTFNAGETSATITVSISDDNVVEGIESFTVDLSNAVGATISDAQAIGTINDDDTVSISISDVTVNESEGSVSFIVTLSNPSTSVVTVDYATVDDSAEAGSDYTADSGTLIFNPGQTSVTVTIALSDLRVVEEVENFVLELSNASGATISISQAVATINDDDSAIISISNATVSESDASASFTVSLSNPSASVVTVDYTTVDDSAVAGSDYVANSGTVTFNAEETIQTITVNINDDNVVEGSENFKVDLSNAIGATISDTQAAGTINDDDSTAISISNATVSESDANASFTLTLSNPSASVVTVDYTTVDDSAVAGSDYVANSGTVTFNAGETSATITVNISEDNVVEGTESFTVDLSNAIGATISDAQAIGTINDNDGEAKITIADKSFDEGHDGITTVDFSAVLDKAVIGSFTVDYTVSEGTALGLSDLMLSSGTLSFAGFAGEVQKISVQINGDTEIEPDETFIVTLSNVSNDSINISDSATGTIVNDELDLIANGGFETAGDKEKVATDWNPKRLTVKGDRRKCNTDTKTYSASGDCAFRFKYKGDPLPFAFRAGKLKQSIPAPEVNPGDDIIFSGQFAAQNLPVRAKVIIKAKYDNGEKQKVVVFIEPGSYDYTTLSDSMTLTGVPFKLVVIIKPRNAKGTLWVDDVVVLHARNTIMENVKALQPLNQPQTRSLQSTLDLPEPPADFRN